MSKESSDKSTKRTKPQFNNSGYGSNVDVNETDGMDNAADGAMDEARNQIQNTKNAVNEIKNAPEDIKRTVDKTKKNINKVKNAPKKIKDRTNKLKRAIKNAPKKAKEIGSKALKVVRHPIKEGLLKAPQALKNMINPKKFLDKINPINKIKRKINETKKKIQKLKNIPKKIQKLIRNIQKIIKLAIKATKAAIKAAIKITQLAIKLIQLLIQIIIATWPIWLIALVLGLIIGVIWWILDNDSTSDNKTYTAESAQYNETITDENGNAKISSVSGSTKVIEAFYQYFSEKSLWVVYEGTVYNDEKIEHDDVYGNVFSPLQYNSQKFDEKFKDPDTGEIILKDYENRESMFYINPNALFVFDKYLHGEQIRFPEQIVQHVAYDYNPSDLKGKEVNETNDKSCLMDYDSPENRFILKQLTDDDNRNLTITSQKYKKIKTSDSSVSDTFKTDNPSETSIYVPDGNEKTLGVWDYGLGSILHYVKYLIKHENRGSYSDFEVWDNTIVMDPNTGLQTSGTVKKFDSYDAYEEDDNKDNYTATDIADLTGDDRLKTYTEDDCPDSMKTELAHEDSYFIDWVVTPAGDITNNIIYDWRDSNEKFTQPETFKSKETKTSEQIVTNKEEMTITRTPSSSGSDCSETTTYECKKVLPRPVRDSLNGTIKDAEFNGETKTYNWSCNATASTSYTCSKCGSVSSSHDTSKCGGSVSSSTTYDHSNCESSATVEIEVESVESSKEKVNQTFTSHVKGTRWDKKPYYDGEPNMENLTGRRYYEDYLTHYDTYVPNEVSGFFDYNSLMKRINASNDDDLKAILERNSMDSNSSNSLDSSSGEGGTASDDVEAFIQKAAPIAVEDGLHTGIFPSITIAQAIYEGGHGTSNLAKNYYNHFGMSAHEVGQTITFWDGSSYVGESMTSSSGRKWQSWASASSSDEGLRFSILDHSRNFWKSKLPYIAAGVTSHISAGLSADQAKEEATKQLAELQPIYAPDSDGNSGYQKNILNIIETYNLWQYDEEMIANGGWDGTNPYPELGGSGNGGSGDSSIGDSIKGAISSIWSWLKGVMETIRDKYATLFGRDTYYNILDETERFKWNYHPVQESDVNYVLQSLFAYTDGEVISKYYDKLDNEFFQDYYTTLFSNPIGTKWNSSSAQDLGTNSFYGEQQTMYYPNGFERPLEECKLSSDTSNYGAYLQATDGENVFAASDGTITKVGEDDKYGGKYIILDNGTCKTIYGHLKDIKVKKGQSVKSGDVIATVDGKKLFFGITNENNVVVDPTFVLAYATNDGTLGGQIASYSTQWVGGTYIYGANWNGEKPYTPTDCSGFVHAIYKHFGLNVPRQSGALATAGISISVNELQPGDIICYSTNGKVSGVHHVAIYIGNGKICHASNHKKYPAGGVKISNMTYSSDTKICRRLITS